MDYKALRTLASLALGIALLGALAFLVIQPAAGQSGVTPDPPPVPGKFDGIPFSPPSSLRTPSFSPPTPYSLLPTPYSLLPTPFALCLTTARVWGLVGAGETVTVTVNGVQMGATFANDIGFFWTTLYAADGHRPALAAGNVVRIYHNGVQAASVTLRSIAATVDVGLNTVFGAIGGVTSPIPVTVVRLDRGSEPASGSLYSVTVNSAGSGAFVAPFGTAYTLQAEDPVAVSYVQNGVTIERHFYADRITVAGYPFNSVSGWAAAGTGVVATVYSDATTIRGQATSTVGADGYYGLNTDIFKGDTVVVALSDGRVMSRTVTPLTIAVDIAHDRLTGIATPGSTVYGWVSDLRADGAHWVQARAAADATGVYTVAFAGRADLMPGVWGGVTIPDAEGDDLTQWAGSPTVNVNQTYDEVSGALPAPPGKEGADLPVTLTLYSAAAGKLLVYAQKTGDSGSYTFNADTVEDMADIAPGDVVTVTGAGWQGGVAIRPITVQPDLANDRLSGTVIPPTARVELHSTNWIAPWFPAGGGFDVLATATGGAFAAAIPGFDITYGTPYEAAHRTADGYAESVSGEVDSFGVNVPGNVVRASLAPPGTPFTFTLYNSSGGFKARMTGISQPPTGFTGRLNFWNVGERIEVGDRVWVQSAGGFSQSVVIPAISLLPNLENSVITGQGPANTLLLTMISETVGFVPTGSDGHFAFAVDDLQQAGGVLTWGEPVGVMSYTPDRAWVYMAFQWPGIVPFSQMDGVNGVRAWNPIPGNPILITVTHPVSGILTGATAAGTCDNNDATCAYLDFPPGSIVPGAVVTADFGDSLVDSVEVVALGGTADPDTDRVTGFAPPLSKLYLFITNFMGEKHEFRNVPVDASGVYTVDCGSDGWDVRYGDTFYVDYETPHYHAVEYVFWLPAPELGIQKQTTSGVAQPGASAIYAIRYWNYGNGAAEAVVITDTLPVSTTYAANSGGFPATVEDGVVTWTLGDIPPSTDNTFYVALTVDAAAPPQSALAPNCAGIATSSPGDFSPGNEQSCSGTAWVSEAKVGVGVKTWPQPNDPHPGEEMVYLIEYGSEGSGATGPAWLTDTLPLSTTFVRWEEVWGWEGLWTEVQTTGGQVVLHAPAGIPGDMGGRIRLVVRVDPDAPLGTLLTNAVLLTVPEDGNPGTNTASDASARVGPARYDVGVKDKRSEAGVLTPGGWIQYTVDTYNAGNVAAQAWVTDILQPGMTYQPGSGQDEKGRPIAPITITEDAVVWDLGLLAVDAGASFNYTLDVGDDLPPDTVITDCAVIGTVAPDADPTNNTSCIAMPITAPGPNLRVMLSLDWQKEGQVSYWARFDAIGNETVTNVWLTDTLPAATQLKEWWLYYDDKRLISQTQTAEGLTLGFSQMDPGDTARLNLLIEMDDPEARPRWYTHTVAIDTPPGDPTPWDNVATHVLVRAEVERVELTVGAFPNVWGTAVSGVVTVTGATTQVTVTTMSQCSGCWGLGTLAFPLYPGDTITVTAGRGLIPVVIHIPNPFTAAADSTADVVVGQIAGWLNRRVEVEGKWNDGYREATTDASGVFTATYSDIPRGAFGELRYTTEIAAAEVIFRRFFYAPDLLLKVNYGHDWVEGNYEVGHTVWLTVTNSAGATKGTATGETAVIPWWSGQTGFSTNYNVFWRGAQPDIRPGDWVYGAVEDGAPAAVRIGTITGVPDMEADVLSGTITAAWFTQTLEGGCTVWGGSGGPDFGFTVDPQGGSYICDFTAWDWDLQPGQTVAVHYTEPDGDQVLNAFEMPAPHLYLAFWGDGLPTPGGNFDFHLQYQNGGNTVAEGVVITQTLPEGMAYLSDTSGFPHSGSNPIVWDLSDVAPGGWSQFDVFVAVTAPSGTFLSSQAEIATANPYDQGDPEEKRGEWGGMVTANDTRLAAKLWPWTGDPAPGVPIVFDLNLCNNGSTASSDVTLTDTLHPSMTLQTWWAQDAGWGEVARDTHRLALTRPTVPGWQCSEVTIRALLDAAAWPGMVISNTLVITAANDLGSGDNRADWEGNVNSPHVNLSIDNELGWGNLTPGGELRYTVNYQNNGNTPVTTPLRITDTLPVNTMFVSAWRYDRYGSYEVTPVYTGTEAVVWEINGLDNGTNDNFEVRLVVDALALPGTHLTNTVAISPQPDEDNEDDNVSVWGETLRAHGPNLRVRASGGWHGYDEGHNAWYHFAIENIGDVEVASALLTDTFPLSIALDGGISTDWSRVSRFNLDPAARWFTATLNNLHPGYRLDFNFAMVITDSAPVPFGLVFTNAVTITSPPDDTYPSDNAAETVLSTGPDLCLEKWLSGGSRLPGEGITFTLRFGNRKDEGHTWWWPMQGNAWLTDTLPAGLTFITSTLRWCGDQNERCGFEPLIHGAMLVWQFSPMEAGKWNEVDLAVRLPVTATGLDAFTNQAVIASDQPFSDTEGITTNNIARAGVAIDLPYFRVGKTYTSSRIAGTPVTYTLTVTNSGYGLGTGVILSDTIPEGLSGVHGGTLQLPWLLWRIAAIAANGGTAQAQFDATLPCVGSVVNSDYRVAGSDQGVSGAGGAPVSFAVVAPTVDVRFSRVPAGSVAAGAPVVFTATATTNGAPLHVTWDFGDGMTLSDALVATHVYTREDAYLVTVTAADPCGNDDIAFGVIQVRAPVMTAAFAQSASAIVVSRAVAFTDTSTTDGAPIVAWAWDFGDASAPALAQNARHTYTRAGMFPVALIVTDTLGYHQTGTGSVTVRAPALVAAFTQNTALAEVGATVAFTDASTTDGPPIVAWAWDFGDETAPAFTRNTAHLYNSQGDFTVTLTVSDSLGYTDGVAAQVHITRHLYRVYLPVVMKK